MSNLDLDLTEVDMEEFGRDGMTLREIADRFDVDYEEFVDFLDENSHLRIAWQEGKEDFMYSAQDQHDPGDMYDV